MTFGDRLRFLRNKKNLSQEDLAQKLGINRVAVTNYEKNERFPGKDSLIKLANVLDTTLDYLILGREKIEVLNSKGMRVMFIPVVVGFVMGKKHEPYKMIADNKPSIIPIDKNKKYYYYRVTDMTAVQEIFRTGDMILFESVCSAEAGDVVMAVTEENKLIVGRFIQENDFMGIIGGFHGNQLIFRKKDIENRNIAVVGKAIEITSSLNGRNLFHVLGKTNELKEKDTEQEINYVEPPKVEINQ